MEAHGRCPAGSPRPADGLAGLALQEPRPGRRSAAGCSPTARSSRPRRCSGVYLIEARDLDHALELAKMTPIVDGGVEVRPLLGFEIVEDS